MSSKLPSTKKSSPKKSARTKKKITKKVVAKKAVSKKITPKKKAVSKKVMPKKKAAAKRPGRKVGDSASNKGKQNKAYNTKSRTSEDVEMTAHKPEDAQTARVFKLESDLIKLLKARRKTHKSLTTDIKEYLGELSYYWRLQGKTHQWVADHYNVGVSTIFACNKDFEKKMHEFAVKDQDFYRNMQILIIEDMITAGLPYCKEHTITEVVSRRSRNDIVMKEVTLTKPPDPVMMNSVRGLLERLSKLVGSDMPAQLEVTDKPYVMVGPAKSANAEEWAKEGNVEIKGSEAATKH